MTDDAHARLVEAIKATMPGASWQRCRTHYAANPMSTAPQASWPAVKAMLRSVYDQSDPASVHAQFDKLRDTTQAKPPTVHVCLGKARADLLAFTVFPRAVWRQIWSDNPNERPNRDVGRRADVIRIFLDRTFLIRLVGAVSADQHEERTEGRRCLGLEVMDPCWLSLADTTETGEEGPDTALDAISA